VNKKDLDKIKKILQEKRDDLKSIVRRKRENDLTDVEVGDEIDTASATSEKEMIFELTDNEKVIIDGIEAALRRIEKGIYGKCESCGEGINAARLKAIPWVRYCIQCQEDTEKTK